MKNKEHIFSLLNYSDNCMEVLNNIRRHEEYDETIDEQQNKIELNPEEISKILKSILGLKEIGIHGYEEKEEILQYIFKYAKSDSINNFFCSDDCIDLLNQGNNLNTKNILKALMSTLPDDKREEMFDKTTKKQKAMIFEKIGLIKNDTKFIIESIDGLFAYSKEIAIESRKKLELIFALYDIDIDISKYEQAPQEIFEDENFKEKINELYNSLNEFDRNKFINDLSYNQDRREIFCDTDPERLEIRLKTFEAIKDDEKYENARLSLLYGALELDTVKDDMQRFQMLIYMYDRFHCDEEIGDQLGHIRDGEKDLINISIEEAIDALEAGNIDENSLIAIGLLGTIPREEIKKYLISKPSKFLTCASVLDYDELDEVFQNIDSQEYMAKLLLSVNGSGQDVSPFFPYIEDNYVRAQIVLSKSDNYLVTDKKKAMENIANYMQIKEAFLQLAPEDRVQFLKQLGEDEEYEDYDEMMVQRKDRNMIKESLLEYLNHDERMEVIQTMENSIDPAIRPYNDLANEMILEYINDKFELTDPEIERLFLSLYSYDVYFSNFLESNVYGRTHYYTRDIEIKSSSLGNLDRLIVDLIHEKTHSQSNINFLQSGRVAQKDYEEGMADTFAELVSNYYFEKHPSVEIDGRTYEPELPLLSQSSYNRENSIVKSMLYPLEQSGMDAKAIQEYLLGDKNRFFNLCYGNDFSKNIDHDYLGNPLNVEFDGTRLVTAHIKEFERLNENSLYMQRNDNIRHYSEFARDKGALFRASMTVQHDEYNISASSEQETQIVKESEERGIGE